MNIKSNLEWNVSIEGTVFPCKWTDSKGFVAISDELATNVKVEEYLEKGYFEKVDKIPEDAKSKDQVIAELKEELKKKETPKKDKKEETPKKEG